MMKFLKTVLVVVIVAHIFKYVFNLILPVSTIFANFNYEVAIIFSFIYIDILFFFLLPLTTFFILPSDDTFIHLLILNAIYSIHTWLFNDTAAEIYATINNKAPSFSSTVSTFVFGAVLIFLAKIIATKLRSLYAGKK